MGEKLLADVVLAIKELNRPELTHMGHAVKLAPSGYNALSEKRRKEAVFKS